MTLLELIKHLRESILDDVGGTNVEWEELIEDNVSSTQLRWTNEELTRFINEAQNRVAADILAIKDSSTYSLTVVADTAEYALDPTILQVKGMYSDNSGLRLTEQEYEDLEGVKSWRSKTGTPTHYMLDIETSKVRLYPTPEVDDTIYLTVYRLPTPQFDWELSDIQSCEIRTEYQIPMLNWAAYMAYMKDEANTFDPQRANYFRQLYVADFTYNSPYADVRRRRSSNRTVSYGGI
ncbi:MAG: hypothetical protein KJO69_00630 [Gammaproteobacteria bacterium]|nr:hypothetical protein [Gammaproteobacteria bacterium]